jgi:hypothetical protein
MKRQRVSKWNERAERVNARAERVCVCERIK